ncbi:acyl carrier protein [Pelatocladus sp. BLCC-F211]|uniref:acyl carrier protein n=1 Tax=Pelatocladus sp. BLCC-F211 TaxID=3342752 RepID=UPI0035B70E26
MDSNEVVIRLASVTPGECEQWLIDYLSNKLKLLLLIEWDEYLPLAQNYFELGLTSLKLQQFKQEIESDINITVSLEVFFNNPTIASLVTYLQSVVLKDYFPRSAVLGNNGESRSETSYTTNLEEFVFTDFGDYEFNEQVILEGVLKSLGLSDC